MDAERSTHGDRLHELLERAVGEHDDHDHDDRGIGPLRTERDEHRERPGAPGAEERDVGGSEVHDRDRPRLRYADDERAEADDDAVERGDGGDAHEVAPQRLQRAGEDDVADHRRHAEVALRPRPDHRTVLEEEEEAQGGEREEHGQRGEGLDPGRHAGDEGVEALAQPLCWRHCSPAVRSPSSRRDRGASPGSCRLPARASASAPTPGSRCPRRSSPRRPRPAGAGRGRRRPRPRRVGARGAGACRPAVTSPRRSRPRRRQGPRSCS